MKTPARPGQRLQGTILIFALVIILAGTLVLLGWAQMMATAATHPDTAAEGIKNRITYENSRALARQFLLESLPSGTNTYSSASNEWWRFEMYLRTNFWMTTNQSPGNPFSPFGGLAFVVTNTNSGLYYGTSRLQHQFLIKSRSPLLAGYGLVQHRPASETAWTPPTNRIYSTNTIGFNGIPQIPFTSGTNTNGYSGYFSSPMSTNYIPQTNNVTGISINNATGAGATNTTTNMVGARTNTTYWGGSLGLVLNTSQTSSILHFVVPGSTNYATNINSSTRTTYTNAKVSSVTIVGKTTSNALHIIIPTTNTNTTTVILSGTNNARRVYLNKQGSPDMELRTETTTESYRWWFGATLSNSTLTITAPTDGQSLTITNGLRSDQNITLQSGALNIVADPNPTYNSEIIADRILWIEDGLYR